VEWEETLDLSAYALRLRPSYLHRLPELLEAFEASGRLARAQKVGGEPGCMQAAVGVRDRGQAKPSTPSSIASC
jgi:hypothetical protein